MAPKTIATLIAIGIAIAAIFGIGTYGGYLIAKKELPPKPTPVEVVLQDEPVIMRTNGGFLEVATITATEAFKQATDHTILGVPLGQTIAEIRVKAIYRYHVALAQEWKFIRRDKVFVAIAPPIKPSLPVAIDTNTLQAHANGTWSVLTGTSHIGVLQKSITAALAEKSVTPHYLILQREHARKTVTEFVQKWVLSQEKWKNGGYTVRVFFADEPIEQIRANGYYPVPVN